MLLSNEQIEEMKILLQFDLSSSQNGLKIHSSATQDAVDAARRLFEKGLVNHVDGGYLTPLGHEAAEHVQAARRLLLVS